MSVLLILVGYALHMYGGEAVTFYRAYKFNECFKHALKGEFHPMVCLPQLRMTKFEKAMLYRPDLYCRLSPYWKFVCYGVDEFDKYTK
jgi:hypothetical protein